MIALPSQSHTHGAGQPLSKRPVEISMPGHLFIKGWPWSLEPSFRKGVQVFLWEEAQQTQRGILDGAYMAL